MNISKAKPVFSKFAANLIIAAIELYQLTLSRWIGGQCRFVPSCSEYAKESLQKFGAVRGLFLAAGRIFRCNPFCQGGYDPPDRE